MLPLRLQVLDVSYMAGGCMAGCLSQLSGAVMPLHTLELRSSLGAKVSPAPGAAAAAPLAQAIAGLPHTVRALHMDGVDASGAAAGALAAALKDKQHLAVLTLEGVGLWTTGTLEFAKHIGAATQLVHLELKGNGMASAFAMLSPALACLTGLTYLGLHGNDVPRELAKECMTMLIDTLPRLRTIEMGKNDGVAQKMMGRRYTPRGWGSRSGPAPQ